MSDHKKTRREKTRQLVALAIAGIMIFSVIGAAVLSQVW